VNGQATRLHNYDFDNLLERGRDFIELISASLEALARMLPIVVFEVVFD
jgi:hypothetical protein